MYSRCLKRGLDLLISVPAVLVLAPFLFVLALMIAWRLGRPVLFKQRRPGLNGKIFTVYKFRTMTDARDERGELKSDAERLTRFGRFLRSTSLDELPELFNIIRGDMSLVGPRPLLVEYLTRYSPEQARRHEVRPGLTGWAQVNGRNALSWEDRFRLDVWYVERCSFPLDMKILFLTVWKVVRREGISAKGEATMPAFQGTRQAVESVGSEGAHAECNRLH